MTDWLDHGDALATFLAGLPAAIGLDTEFMRISTFHPRLALVQLGDATRAGLVDPTAGLDPAPLAAFLAAPGRTCIMHSASEDLEALATWSCALGELFDTQIAAAFAGLGAGLGYQRLVHILTGVELSKGETRSDWLRRPLSPAQLEYATQDVTYLPALHAELAERVEQRGYGEWLRADCAALLRQARERSPDPEPQRSIRAASGWPREAQARLRRLLLWRDATAPRIDRPRTWLLDDAHALELAAHPPANGNELHERTRGQRALRGPLRQELLALLQAPLAPEDLEFAPIPAPLDSAGRRIVAAMQEVVAAEAARLDLPASLVCSRRHLETLLTTRQWPARLAGWREELLREPLMARLPS